MIALLAGLAVAWVMSARRPGRATVALVVAVAVAVGLAFAFARGSIPSSLGGSSLSLSKATSGRTSLVSEGVDLFGDRPLAGFGSGSFAQEYRSHISHRPNAFEHHEHLPYERPTTSDSHTTPITIAAEQGLIGLAVYLALLLAGFARVRCAISSSRRSRSRRSSSTRSSTRTSSRTRRRGSSSRSRCGLEA